MTLRQKTQELSLLLTQNSASEENIQTCANAYFELVDTSSDADVAESMHLLSQLFGLENISHGSMASLICGNLIERGYSAAPICTTFILFYKSLLQKAAPFFTVCTQKISQLTEDDEIDEFELVDQLKEDLSTEYAAELQAIEALNSYYACGVSIFSSGFQEFIQGKENLSDVFDYQNYSDGCYWLSKLFEVLFDEPILVIDLVARKGICGRMSGVVDNFQLQLLLMSMPEINDPIQLPEEYIDVVKGYGPQQIEPSVVGKWNMCTWEYLQPQQNAETDATYAESKFWIWSEGTPQHIPVFQGYRVVLLDTPSYQRGLPIQRTFYNLEADILVDTILQPEEIDQWLAQMKRHLTS